MPTGKTKDAGWQIGVSTTLDHSIDDVWKLLASDEGVGIWLGDGVSLDGSAGQTYETVDGIVGEVRSYHVKNRIRLTWQPKDWTHDTTVQLAVTAKDAKTTLRLHQERLDSSAEREQQRSHWKNIAEQLSARLAT